MTSFPIHFFVPGKASGLIVRLAAPLSLWGGFDIETGCVIDATHPNVGAHLSGRIVMMNEARGSSSSSSTLLEAARVGTAPAAIVLARLDPILTIGSLVAKDLYQVDIPIALLEPSCWDDFTTGDLGSIDDEACEIRIASHTHR
jgi:predicted aconitase with swiveling domain